MAKKSTQHTLEEIPSGVLIDVWKFYEQELSSVLDYHVVQSIKTKNLLKRMIIEFGATRLKSMISFIIRNWSLTRKKYSKIYSAYPSIAMIYGFRQTFMDDYNEYKKQKRKRRRVQGGKTNNRNNYTGENSFLS